MCLSLSSFFYCSAAHRALHSFPTRRSSDLRIPGLPALEKCLRHVAHVVVLGVSPHPEGPALQDRDRKSTRLNSSHQIISYAVFCLKKKTNKYIFFCTTFPSCQRSLLYTSSV